MKARTRLRISEAPTGMPKTGKAAKKMPWEYVDALLRSHTARVYCTACGAGKGTVTGCSSYASFRKVHQHRCPQGTTWDAATGVDAAIKSEGASAAAVKADVGTNHADAQGLPKAESAVSSAIATVIFVPAAAMTT